MAWASGQVLERNEAEALLELHPGPIRKPRGVGEITTPHPGTLHSLVDRYQRKRRRLTTVGTGGKSRQLFTQPPKASFRRTGYDTPSHGLHFELRGSEGGFAPRPLASAAPLIIGLRDAAAKRLRESLPEKSALFERLIIGRGAGSCRSCPAHQVDTHTVNRGVAYGPFHPARHGRDPPGLSYSTRRLEVGVCWASTS